MPVLRAMALVTVRCGVDVRRCFARGLGAVVAAGAVIAHITVVKKCGGPFGGDVAIAAIIGDRNMVDGFACGVKTIVAATATP